MIPDESGDGTATAAEPGAARPDANNPPRTGARQPSRTLALLWGLADDPSPRRGPSRSHRPEQIIDAALALADEEGLGAVTIRAVARRAGMSTMSVYTYVPGKPELLDLMVDALHLAMPRQAWIEGSTWRDRAAGVAEANRQMLALHPWMTEVAALSRPPLGPGTMAKYEHELAAFDDAGLEDIDIDAALTLVLGFVQSHSRSAHDARRAVTDTAMSDADWWAANQPILDQALDPAAYPRAARIGEAAGQAQGSAWSADRAWEFGLERVLDGLGVLIGRG